MAHQYLEPIQVKEDTWQEPLAFTWRHVTYTPLEVIGSWHLKDRWWESAALRARSDRIYYRVQLSTPCLQFFVLYRDASGSWMLDSVLD